MICCMTCPWAPTAGGTTVQSGQRNDGVTAPYTQRLHQRLSHINRTLHAHYASAWPLFLHVYKANVARFARRIFVCALRNDVMETGKIRCESLSGKGQIGLASILARNKANVA